MTDDKTVVLIKEAMLNAGLDEAEATKVAESNQRAALAAERFEVLEERLTDIANAYDKLKTAAKVLGGLILSNWAADIYGLL